MVFFKLPCPGRRRFGLRGRASRAAFTLIELLAVILIISILVAALIPMVNDAVAQANVTACSSNLGNIYKAILRYQTTYKRLPAKSGIRYFAELYDKEVMENTATNAKRLTCPGVDLGALDIGALDWEEWWSDLDAIGPNYSAYAGRDCKRFPLRKMSGKEPLVADDNDPVMNHETTTNVLYGDGSVQTFERKLLEEEGVLLEDELLIVGPESQVPDLTKLSLD